MNISKDNVCSCKSRTALKPLAHSPTRIHRHTSGMKILLLSRTVQCSDQIATRRFLQPRHHSHHRHHHQLHHHQQHPYLHVSESLKVPPLHLLLLLLLLLLVVVCMVVWVALLLLLLLLLRLLLSLPHQVSEHDLPHDRPHDLRARFVQTSLAGDVSKPPAATF